MKLVVFGLTISSSWGNGHATLWRALCRALVRRGHRVVFFERDVPYYAAHRDLWTMEGVDIRLYPDWASALESARAEVEDADASMVTSYCVDAIAATELVAERARLSVFYDLDTPVTLDALRGPAGVAYIGARGLRDFDLVLSFTGGRALADLQRVLGARRVAPLYGSVDPDVHRPTRPAPQYEADLSYLGTYAADRQDALDRLFIEPARRLAERRFVIGGAQYPESFPWVPNIFFVRHLPPSEHSAFFCSSPLTLNVTRRAMAEMGYCPSGRLFEAAACGAAILTDEWDGLTDFFSPGEELLVTRSTEDTMHALSLPREELARIGAAARRRALDEHTADVRAAELERALEDAITDAPLVPIFESSTGDSDPRSLEL
ncbi:MAG TPA: glycosyltransferase [Gemmatimonadaceae bacterium]|nr:glycosyltransferase [Gemmatimonadaceae bacterium]